MIASLLALLAITFGAVAWARPLARRRGRHVSGWALAVAMLPPVVLVLWALPSSPTAQPAPE